METYNVKTVHDVKLGPFRAHIKAKLRECVNCTSPTNVRIPLNQKVSKKLFETGKWSMLQKDSYICSTECLKNILMVKLFELKVIPSKEIEAFVTGPPDTAYNYVSFKDSQGDTVFISLFKFSQDIPYPYVYIYAQKYKNSGAWWRGVPIFIDDNGVRYLQDLFRKDF